MTASKGERSFLPELPGIDCADGLARAMDDEALYASILLEFLSRYRNAPQELRDAREAEDIERISFLVHKLKGVIGTIGARGTFAAAEALESTWSNSQQPRLDSTAFERFHDGLKELLSVLAAVEPLLSRLESGQSPTTTDDSTSLQSQLAELAILLVDSDVAAGPLFKSMRSSLESFIDAGLLASITTAINELQFEQASQLLDEMNSSINTKREKHHA